MGTGKLVVCRLLNREAPSPWLVKGKHYMSSREERLLAGCSNQWVVMSFPSGSVVKKICLPMQKTQEMIPGWGRSLGGGNGNPFQGMQRVGYHWACTLLHYIPFSNKYKNERSVENCLPTAFAEVICDFLIFVLMCTFPTYLTWAFTAYSSIAILPILT